MSGSRHSNALIFFLQVKIMAKKQTELDQLDDDFMDDEDDIELEISSAENHLLTRRRIEELREEKELQYSIWGDMEWQ